MKKTLLYLTLAALGTAGATATYEFLKQEPKQEIKQEKTLEQITFEQAKLNPLLRQLYLDQVLENKEKLGIEYWNSFERLVYDINFEKEKEYLESLGKTANPIPKTVLAVTPTIKKLKGKNQLSFFDKKCFLMGDIKSEEDLISCIDHESVHAYTCKTHELPDCMFKKGCGYSITGKESEEINRLCQEAAAYDVQLSYIKSGKRKISKEFMQLTLDKYSEVCLRLQEISEQNNEDSNLAKITLKILRYAPNK